MTTASNRDRATAFARRPECARSGSRCADGIRIVAGAMQAAARAHRWSRVLLVYVGLLAASVQGKSAACGGSRHLDLIKLIPTFHWPAPPPAARVPAA